MCFAPQWRGIFTDLNFHNSSHTEVFCAFWLRNVLRATAPVQFSQIESSKMRARPWIFPHFDLQMCFAPQRRGVFTDRNFQNSSRAGVFCAFSFTNALRAAAACHFSFLCSTATSAPTALASLLFEHPEPRIIEKTQCFATFLAFAACLASFYWLDSRVDLLSTDLTTCLLSFFRLTWPLSTDLTTLPLCFSTVHIVGS